MSIRSVLIEDILSNRENLRSLLSRHCPEVELIGEADGVESGLRLLANTQPDLVFLDVRLPDGTGFDLLEQSQKRNFALIFVTAFDEYALKAFQLNALDYLMKPIDYKLLKKSVEKVALLENLSDENRRLRNLVTNLKNTDEDKRLALPMEDRTEFIELKQIVYCESENNYTRFHLADGRIILIARTLKKFELALQDSGFIRVHNSFIVRIKSIKSISRRDGGYMILSNDRQIPISRNRKEKVFRHLID